MLRNDYHIILTHEAAYQYFDIIHYTYNEMKLSGGLAGDCDTFVYRLPAPGSC